MNDETKPLVAGDATLDEVRAFFANDRYATVACGAVIEEARPGYARVVLQVEENHLNGMGSLMGGVSFTMADFAFAVASNIGQAPTVSTNCSIDFLGAPKTALLWRNAASKRTVVPCVSPASTYPIPPAIRWPA